jgi:uncharacterized protein YukE
VTDQNDIDNQRTLLELLRQENQSRKELQETKKQLLEASKQERKAQRALRLEMEILRVEFEKSEGNADVFRTKMAELEDQLEESTERTKELGQASTETEKQITDLSASIAKLGSSLTGTLGPFAEFVNVQQGFANGAALVVKTLIDQANKLDKTQVSLAKTTGYATELRDNLYDLADSSNGLNLSMDASEKIIGSLSLGFQDFNFISNDAQKSIAKSVGLLVRLGASAEAAVRTLDLLENGFGMTRLAAQSAIESFDLFAQEIGVPVGQLLTDLNNIGPALSRFGDRGNAVFRDLAKQARSLGLSVQKAFDVTELFDTFQGAADVAGKLNAQLGLQLNSVEIMGASSEDRLRILRAEFNMRGQSFDSMGRRQKQMIAEILKVDVETAKRLFGDPMEMRKQQRAMQDREDRLKAFTSASEKVQESFEQMFVKIAPGLTKLMDFVGFLAENFVIASGAMLTFTAKLAGGFSKIAASVGSASAGFAVLGKAMLRLTGFGAVLVGVFEGFMSGDLLHGVLQGSSFFAGSLAGAKLGLLAAPFLGPFAPLAPIIGGLLGGLVAQAGMSKIRPLPTDEAEEIGDGLGQGRMKITGKGVSAITHPKDVAVFMRRGGPIAEALGGGMGGGNQTYTANLILDGRVIASVATEAQKQNLKATGTQGVRSSIPALGYA